VILEDKMFVLKNDRTVEVKPTGKWYIDPSKYKEEEDVGYGYRLFFVYPSDTLFFEIEYGKKELQCTRVEETGFLWWKRSIKQRPTLQRK
jgi:hypothetical protein